VTVSSTDKEGISRITVSFYGDEKTSRQLKSQTEKLIEVKKVISLDDDSSVCRELLIVKIATNSDDLDAAIRTAADNHFRIVDSINGCMILETTGSPEKIDRKLALLEPFKIVEMCRTGVTALEKGIVDYKF
jgi:acetolactate synthase-1/3 small subunit